MKRYVLRYKLISGTEAYWSGSRWTISVAEICIYTSYAEAEKAAFAILESQNRIVEIVEVK